MEKDKFIEYVIAYKLQKITLEELLLLMRDVLTK